VWFVGLEEGLGDMTSDEARENIKQRAHFSEIMDLREAHLRLKEKDKRLMSKLTPLKPRSGSGWPDRPIAERGSGLE